MKVLMVDENETVVSFMKEMIKNEVYRVKIGQNGEEGYLAYFQSKPEVIITEDQTLEKNSWQSEKEVRMHHPDLSTIYISNNLGRFRSLLRESKNI